MRLHYLTRIVKNGDMYRFNLLLLYLFPKIAAVIGN